MAFRTFDPDTMSAILADDRRAGQALASAPSADFGAFEAAAVWLGQHDDPASLSVGGFSNRLRRLFRLEPPRRLANPRLEGLRRLTLVLRHGYDALLEKERTDALEAGVSQAQIAALEARFAA